MLVIRPLFLAIAFGGNDGGFAGLLQRFEDTRIGIISFVCQEGVGAIRGSSWSAPSRSQA